MIYNILKHAHLLFVAVAVVMFILRFYWLKTGHSHFQKPVFKKIHLHSHYAIILLGAILMVYLGFNPVAESGYWLLEKILAFVAYLVMVSSALNIEKRKHIQWLTFFGSFGWLLYIAKLAVTKQAILLVG